MKPPFKKFISLLFLFLLLNSEALAVMKSYQRTKLSRTLAQRFNDPEYLNLDDSEVPSTETFNLITLNRKNSSVLMIPSSGEDNPEEKEKQTSELSYNQDSEIKESHEKHHRLSQTDSQTKILPIISFLISKSTTDTVVNIAGKIQDTMNNEIKKLKAEILEMRTKSKDRLQKQVDDFDVILESHCLFYKYLRYFTNSYITTLDFQLSMVEASIGNTITGGTGNTALVSEKAKRAENLRSMFTDLIKNIRASQKQVKSHLDEKVFKSCSFNSGGDDLYSYATKELDDALALLEIGKDKDEKVSFSTAGFLVDKIFDKYKKEGKLTPEQIKEEQRKRLLEINPNKSHLELFRQMASNDPTEPLVGEYDEEMNPKVQGPNEGNWLIEGVASGKPNTAGTPKKEDEEKESKGKKLPDSALKGYVMKVVELANGNEFVKGIDNAFTGIAEAKQTDKWKSLDEKGKNMMKVRGWLRFGFGLVAFIDLVLSKVSIPGVPYISTIRMWLGVAKELHEVIRAWIELYAVEHHTVESERTGRRRNWWEEKVKDLRYARNMAVLKFMGVLAIAIFKTALDVAIGPIVDAVIAAFKALYSIYQFVKLWRLKRSEQKRTSNLESELDYQRELLKDFYTYDKCSSVSFIFKQFKEQDEYLKSIEKLLQTNQDLLVTNEVQIKSHMSNFIQRICREDISMCTGSFSRPYIKALVGDTQYKDVEDTILYLTKSGPISSVAIAHDDKEMANLFSIGYKLYMSLDENQKVLICRSCNDRYFLAKLLVFQVDRIDKLKDMMKLAEEAFLKGLTKSMSPEDAKKYNEEKPPRMSAFNFLEKGVKYYLVSIEQEIQDGMSFIYDFNIPDTYTEEIPVLKAKWQAASGRGDNFKSTVADQYVALAVGPNDVNCLNTFQKKSMLQKDRDYLLWGVYDSTSEGAPLLQTSKALEIALNKGAKEGINDLKPEQNLNDGGKKSLTDEGISNSISTKEAEDLKNSLVAKKKLCPNTFILPLESLDFLEKGEHYLFLMEKSEKRSFYESVHWNSVSAADLVFIPAGKSWRNLDIASETKNYQVFYKKIFKPFSIEEQYSINYKPTKDNTQLELSRFNSGNPFFTFLHNFLCQRSVDSNEYFYGAQCYFKDDPLNRVFDDKEVLNYEREYLDVGKLVGALDGGAKEKYGSFQTFNNWVSSIEYASLEEFKEQVGKVIETYFNVGKHAKAGWDIFVVFDEAFNRNREGMKEKFEDINCVIHVPIKFGNCQGSSRFLRGLNKYIEESCTEGEKSLAIEEIYYIRMKFDDEGLDNMKDNKYLENYVDALQGYISHPSFAKSWVWKRNVFSKYYVTLDILVKPAFQIGFIPLVNRHSGSLEDSSSCETNFINIWQLEYTFDFEQKREQDNQYLLRQHMLLTRFFDRPDSPYTIAQSSSNIKKNGIPTLAQIRKLLSPGDANQEEFDSGFAVSSAKTIDSKSRLVELAKLCRDKGIGRTVRNFWIPMQLSSASGNLKFESTPEKISLEEVNDGKEGTVPMNTLYYVELLTDLDPAEKYPVQYSTDTNHKLLKRYGYAPQYPTPLQSGDRQFFFDGVLRGFASSDSKYTLGFRIWTRSDLRLNERYDETCYNRWNGLK